MAWWTGRAWSPCSTRLIPTGVRILRRGIATGVCLGYEAGPLAMVCPPRILACHALVSLDNGRLHMPTTHQRNGTHTRRSRNSWLESRLQPVLGTHPRPAKAGTPAKKWRWPFVVLFGAALAVCHGCHADVDNELVLIPWTH